MEYAFIFLFLALFVLVLYFFRHHKSNADLQQLKTEWGKPKSKLKTQSLNFQQIRKYAYATKEEFHRLSAQTLDDIDFPVLFKFLDRTTSRIGQQYLFKKLIEPISKTEHEAETLINVFSVNKILREEVQKELLRLNNPDAYEIASLLRGVPMEKPKWYPYLIPYIILILGLFVLSFIYPVASLILIFPIILNMFLHIYNRENMLQFSLSIPQLYILISVAKSLVKKGTLNDKKVEKCIVNLRSLERNAKLIRFQAGGSHTDFTHYFFEIIKVIFLIEVFTIFRVSKELKNKQNSIITLFNYIGNIDTSISIASLRAGNIKTCRPTFTERKHELIVRNIFHPLIRNSVKNSLSINKKGILITG